jgi:hypothetical protein
MHLRVMIQDQPIMMSNITVNDYYD